MKRIHGRNRYSGPSAVSAITGISTDAASAYIRRLSNSTDNPRFRIRAVADYEMVRVVSEHGYRLEETVTPYDGRTVADYSTEVRETGGMHLLMTKRVRSRFYDWIVLEKVDGDDAVYIEDRMHPKPSLIPMVYAKDRVIRAYVIVALEDAVCKTSVERRRWTEAEDAAIREAADWNAFSGLTDDQKQYSNRLREVADRLNRTYASVRVRASRIGAVSYSVKRQVTICD